MPFAFLCLLCLFAAPVSSKDAAAKKHKGHKKEVGRILAAVATFALFVPLCGPCLLKAFSREKAQKAQKKTPGWVLHPFSFLAPFVPFCG
jgi:hypothetical protein